MRRSVQHRHAKHHPEPLLARLPERVQHRLLAVQLGLPVQVGRGRRRVGFVRRLAGAPGEDVVGRDVDEEDGTGGAEAREGARGFDVDGARALGVFVDLVGEAVGGAWEGRFVSILLGFGGDGGRLTVDYDLGPCAVC